MKKFSEKVALPISTDIPSAYMLQPMGVLKATEETRDWYCENFINICCDNWKNGRLLNVGNGFLGFYCDVFDYTVLNYDDFPPEEIINKLKVQLNNGNYAFIYLDEYYTSARSAYIRYHFRHGYTHSKYCDSLAVNIDIPTQFSVAISQIMRKQHFGKMIFVSSAAAYVGSRDIPYSISKAAILGLVRGLAKNLSGENVFVYGIAPGIVETNMSSRMNENRKNDAISGTINKRICQPSEIAKAVRFLLIEEDGYMNGSVIHINNGLYFN